MRDSPLKGKSGRHQPHRRGCTAEGPSSTVYLLYVRNGFASEKERKIIERDRETETEVQYK